MEVHHHSHTARKRWTHYIWEFVMLFLAVTLGFLVENYREHYVEKLRIRQYARALVEDLENDIRMIDVVMFRINRNIRFTDSIATYLRGKTPGEIRNIDLFILSSIDRYPPYTWNRATLDQLKNSGSLRYFTNKKIVRAISTYDAFTKHMDEDQKGDDEMANRASQLRSQIIDMDYDKEFTMGLRNNIDSVIKLEVTRELRSNDSTKLISYDPSRIRNYLNEKINIRKHLMIRAQEELPRLKTQAAELIQILKKEYH